MGDRSSRRSARSVKSNAAKHRRPSPRRTLRLESLEERLAPAGLAPVAMDDAFEVTTALDQDPAITITLPVLNNDTLPGAAMSLAITQFPEHGTVTVADHSLFDEPFDFTRFDDESSLLGDGHASALTGVVDEHGQLKLKVATYGSSGGIGGVPNNGDPGWGDYALYIRIGASDFSNFDPQVFDFEFRDRLAPYKVDAYNLPRLAPGTPFIAWIDNTVGNGTPDTFMAQVGELEFQYVPEPGYHGTDTFRYTIIDEDGRVSNEAIVTVTYLNQAPLIWYDSGYATTKDTPIVIDFLSSAEDVDGIIDPNSVALVVGPSEGTIERQETEYGPIYLYTPHADALNLDTIQFTVRDNSGSVSNVGTITIYIVDGDPANQPPTIGNVNVETPLNTAVVLDPLSFASDADGTVDLTSLAIAEGPEHGSAVVQASPSGLVILYTPDANYAGDDFFYYTVRDNKGAISAQGIASIFVGNHPPEVVGDSAYTAINSSVSIEVLANDFDPGGTFDPASLAIATNPRHGTAIVQHTPTGPVILFTPASRYFGDDIFFYSIRDNSGILAGRASVAIFVQQMAYPDEAATTSNTPVVIDVLANDYAYPGALVPATLLVTSGPSRGSIRFEDTDSGRVVVYTPAASISTNLVVDDPIDRDDGNYSAGHLSLREAIKLANDTGYYDTITYTVSDDEGVVSNPGVVTIHVAAQATTITFAASLTARGSRTLTLSQAGDTSEGNSALAIKGPISIVGPAGAKRITLAGPGSAGDLRLFVVTPGGELTMKNLTLASGASDSHGGALFVAGNAKATLTNVAFANHFAYDKGGAIFNFGELTITNGQFTGNEAFQGGAIANYGTLSMTGGSFSSNHAEQGGAVDIEFGLVAFAGVSFTKNIADDRGGGIFNAGDLSLSQVTLTDNRAVEGAGVFNLGGAMIDASTISRNRADQGGGIKNGSGAFVAVPGREIAGRLTVTNSFVKGNSARLGAGLYNVGYVTATGGAIANNRATKGGGIFATESGAIDGAASVSLSGIAITGNRAGQGAGLYVDLGTVAIGNSLFHGNIAIAQGGAIYNDSGLSLLNVTLAANSAKRGGGLYNAAGIATIANTTISGNSAMRGGGIYNDVGFVSLVSTIVAGNRGGLQASDIAGPTPISKTSSHHNLIGRGGSGGLLDGELENQVGANPLLAVLGSYGGPVKTFALLPGSAAIDRGYGDEADARGLGRVAHARHRLVRKPRLHAHNPGRQRPIGAATQPSRVP